MSSPLIAETKATIILENLKKTDTIVKNITKGQLENKAKKRKRNYIEDYNHDCINSNNNNINNNINNNNNNNNNNENNNKKITENDNINNNESDYFIEENPDYEVCHCQLTYNVNDEVYVDFVDTSSKFSVNIYIGTIMEIIPGSPIKYRVYFSEDNEELVLTQIQFWPISMGKGFRHCMNM